MFVSVAIAQDASVQTYRLQSDIAQEVQPNRPPLFGQPRIIWRTPESRPRTWEEQRVDRFSQDLVVPINGDGRIIKHRPAEGSAALPSRAITRVAVVLDLVNPVGAGRRLVGWGRQAGLDNLDSAASRLRIRSINTPLI